MHRALSYLLVLHSSIAVPPTHLHSAPSGVRLYQVAAHALFIASFSSFVFGVVHCTVLATSRCNNGTLDGGGTQCHWCSCCVSAGLPLRKRITPYWLRSPSRGIEPRNSIFYTSSSQALATLNWSGNHCPSSSARLQIYTRQLLCLRATSLLKSG